MATLSGHNASLLVSGETRWTRVFPNRFNCQINYSTASNLTFDDFIRQRLNPWFDPNDLDNVAVPSCRAIPPTENKIFYKKQKDTPMTPQEKNQRFFHEIDRIMEANSEENFLEDFFKMIRCNFSDSVSECERFDYTLNNQIIQKKNHFEEAKDFFTKNLSAAESEKSDIHAYRRYILNSFEKIIEKIRNGMDQENKILDAFKKTIKKDFISELITLNNLYPFDPETGNWSLPDYTLSTDSDGSHDFHGLQIHIYPKEKDVSNAIEIRSLGYIEKVDDYFHPHVSHTGRVCWGDAQYPAQVFWENRKFVALFQIIDSLLGTYNNESPYVTLKHFIGKDTYTCECCGTEMDSDEVLYHNNGDIGCDECLRFVEGKNEYYWEDETRWSKIQGEFILDRDAVYAIYKFENSLSESFPIFSWIEQDHPDAYICDCCGEYVYDAALVKDGLLSQSRYEILCQKCYNEQVTTCENCHNVIDDETIFSRDEKGNPYCEHCSEECEECGECVPAKDLNENYLCEKCQETINSKKEEEAA
jgi:hypothetical protein